MEFSFQSLLEYIDIYLANFETRLKKRWFILEDIKTKEMQVLAPPAHPLIKKELYMIKPFLEISYKNIA